MYVHFHLFKKKLLQREPLFNKEQGISAHHFIIVSHVSMLKYGEVCSTFMYRYTFLVVCPIPRFHSVELVSSLFTDCPPLLSLPVYIVGDSIGFYMESALGPDYICKFPYGIIPFQKCSFVNLTKLVSIWKHLELSGHFVWISQRSLRSVPLSGIFALFVFTIVLVFAIQEYIYIRDDYIFYYGLVGSLGLMGGIVLDRGMIVVSIGSSMLTSSKLLFSKFLPLLSCLCSSCSLFSSSPSDKVSLTVYTAVHVMS